MLKRLLFVIMANVMWQLSYSQSEADIKLPKIVPPSPDAAALGKYGQIPVSKSTGIPSIEIPIYEIRTPRFTLPISLSYHASGVKVEEMASWVGVGWSLNAGGMITRSIIGLSDDYPSAGYITNSIKKASEIQWPLDIQYIADALNGRMDTDPDNFFYNFNNHSGSFVFGDNKKPVLIPYKPVNIHFDSPTKNFDITDENGDIYYFNTKEDVVSSISPTYMSGISTWYLTKMVSADRSDTLNFVYTTDAAQLVSYSYNFTQSTGANAQGGFEALQPLVLSKPWRTFYPVRIQSITFNGGKVDFVPKGGRLDHGNYSLDSVIVYNQNPTNKKYTRIKRFKAVTDYFYGTGGAYFEGDPVSDIDRYRLKLTGLQELSPDNVIIKTHQFGYNATSLPHVHSFAQDRWGYYNGKNTNLSLLESQTVILNPHSLSPTIVKIGMDGTNVGVNGLDKGADRSASLEYMQAGVLNKITYPTGGFTTLTYDCHKYMGTVTTKTPVGANAIGGTSFENVVTLYTPTEYMLANGGNIFEVQVGGVKDILPLPYVKVVRVYDSAQLYSTVSSISSSNLYLQATITLPLEANVQYQLIGFAHNATTPNNSIGIPIARISTSYPVETKAPVNVGGLRVSSIKNYDADGSIASTETYTYGNNDESGVGVQLAFSPTYKNPKVIGVYSEQNDPGGLTCRIDIMGRIYYSNNSVYPLSTFSGSAVAYPTVTLYHGAAALNTGKSTYTYDIYTDSVAVFGPSVDQTKPISVTWKNGEARRERHYRNYGNNLYTLVQEITNEFQRIPRKKGLGTRIGYAKEPLNFPFNGPILNGTVVQAGATSCGWIEWSAANFYWYDYPISTGSCVLKQSTNTQYSIDGTSVATTTRYYYDNLKHMFPTRITTCDSKGDSIKKAISYPQDMVAAGKDPTGIYNSMTAANMISPAIEQYQSKNSTQLFYEKNNYGIFNTSMIKLKSVERQTLANPVELRLQYLEYDSKGNPGSLVKDTGPKVSYRWGYKWKYPVAEVLNAASNEFYYEGFEENTSATTGTGHTGDYYYAGTNYTVTWPLPNARTYVISYWYLSGGVWKYMLEQPFTGTLTLNNGSGYDDIRVYPKDARMKTYTYTSLLGATSETDPGGRTIYYKYDNAGRLGDIRDQDGNVVKTIQYNYQQP